MDQTPVVNFAVKLLLRKEQKVLKQFSKVYRRSPVKVRMYFRFILKFHPKAEYP